MSKKKILLLSDDIRFTSGVSTMARELVFGTLKNYDWVNCGGAIRHPEQGKIIDLSDHAKQITGVQDAYMKIYPVHEYGNEAVINEILHIEKPDAMVLFTDPRYFGHVFNMEKQIRSKIPLTYINIWDSNPYCQWNRPAYSSVDTFFNISKQTDNIVEHVLRSENCFRLPE